MENESTEYPLAPFLDFADPGPVDPDGARWSSLVALGDSVEGATSGWGDWTPERRADPVEPFADYSGVGEDNPYVERGHDSA